MMDPQIAAALAESDEEWTLTASVVDRIPGRSRLAVAAELQGAILSGEVERIDDFRSGGDRWRLTGAGRQTAELVRPPKRKPKPKAKSKSKD